jgi:hypothetical protein
MMLMGAVIIAAVAGVAFFATQNGGYPGSIVFGPTTVVCSSQPLTTTVKLPASLKATDRITIQLDGAIVSTQSVTDFGLAQQADGAWYKTTTASAECSIGVGAHTQRILGSSGHVLAQGSFTLVAGPGQSAGPSSAKTAKASPTWGPTAKPTPKPSSTPKPTPSPTPGPLTGSSVTIEPASFSCSGPDVDVTLTVVLSASIPGSAIITPTIDGTQGTSGSVESAFEQQPDGSWMESETGASSDLCTRYGVGQHTIGALDSDGHLIAEGSFTVMP